MRNLIIAVTLLAGISFTSCNKEAEAPAPEQTTSTTVTTPPIAAKRVLSYVMGNGFTDLHLEVRDTANNQMSNGAVPSPSSPGTGPVFTFQIYEDLIYTYTITGNSSSLFDTGTYGYSSTLGFWHLTDSPTSQVEFIHSSGTYDGVVTINN